MEYHLEKDIVARLSITVEANSPEEAIKKAFEMGDEMSFNSAYSEGNGDGWDCGDIESEIGITRVAIMDEDYDEIAIVGGEDDHLYLFDNNFGRGDEVLLEKINNPDLSAQEICDKFLVKLLLHKISCINEELPLPLENVLGGGVRLLNHKKHGKNKVFRDLEES